MCLFHDKQSSKARGGGGADAPVAPSYGPVITEAALKIPKAIQISRRNNLIFDNLDLTKSLGTSQIRSLNRGFVISRFFFHIFYYYWGKEYRSLYRGFR